MGVTCRSMSLICIPGSSRGISSSLSTLQMVQVWLQLVKNQGHFIWRAVLPGCISASTASLKYYRPDNVEFDRDTGNGSGYFPYTSVSPANHNFTKFRSWIKL